MVTKRPNSTTLGRSFQDMTTQGPCKVITTHEHDVREKALASIPFTIDQQTPLMKVNCHLTKGKVVQRRSLMVKRTGY
jgi:hypothetical protein